jgi:hypothetical protein
VCADRLARRFSVTCETGGRHKDMLSLARRVVKGTDRRVWLLYASDANIALFEQRTADNMHVLGVRKFGRYDGQSMVVSLRGEKGR